ncbi:SRPBCC family protein [Virgisporangium aurantiacum]|uniref:SRPBCC family protein n=1 Tax=Virgisporangium aurantiacum TaxID=175570 RepID=UPI001EF36FA5|nr:SRPBCC family protein [Virgisporangium aurantiacum]
MKLEHTFTVPVPVEKAWEVLLDLPRVAPCMPGATLTGVEGDEFTGTVKVKLGPIGLTYSGKGRFVERDEAAHRVVVEASGRDTRSAGTAGATITAHLVGQGEETLVDVVTDLTVTGKPAQFGRGMISDVSAKLLGQFADCLAGKLGGGDEPAAPVEAAAVSGGSGDVQPAAAPAATATLDEAEPVDLFRLAGSTDAARKTAVYGLGALVLAVIAWVLVRSLRRR